MSLRPLLTLSGGLEILAGLPALITPAPLISLLLGGPVDPIAVVLARLFGAGVFALGLACLKARNDVGSPAGLAVSLGITSYNVLAAVVLIWTVQQGRASAAGCCGERGFSMPSSALCSYQHS
jgi:hypothetical protein